MFRADINGYSGVFDEGSLNQLRNDASVASIEPDYVASISYAISPSQSSTLPARHRPRGSLLCTFLSYCPTTDEKDNGTGVDIYGLGECSWFSGWKSGSLVCRDNGTCKNHGSITDMSTRHWHLYRAQRFRRTS